MYLFFSELRCVCFVVMLFSTGTVHFWSSVFMLNDYYNLIPSNTYWFDDYVHYCYFLLFYNRLLYIIYISTFRLLLNIFFNYVTNMSYENFGGHIYPSNNCYMAYLLKIHHFIINVCIFLHLICSVQCIGCIYNIYYIVYIVYITYGNF